MPIQGVSAVQAGATAPDARPTAKNAKDAGVQFESLMMGQLLKTMREAGQGGWLGTGDDEDQIKVITNNCPAAMSLSSRTGFADIVVIARAAVGALGNDTGPMHLIAAARLRSPRMPIASLPA